MSIPESLTFTDYEVPTAAIFKQRQESSPMNRAWTRVQFAVPDSWEASRRVVDWLNENCPNRYCFYCYQNPRGSGPDYIMVVRFEDKNDALIFKLRGGHQAWESAQ